MDTVDRLFELVDQKYAEQRFFAADLGIAVSVVSAWRNRNSKSYNKYLPQIAAILGTTVEYLLTGDQPDPVAQSLFSQEDEAMLRKIHDSPDLRVMFSLTSKASPEDVKKALDIIRIVLNKPEELP